MAKKKSSAPKVEPKAKPEVKPAIQEPVSPETPTEEVKLPPDPSEDPITQEAEEINVKDPSSDLRFHVGDIAQHNGSNYLCIATNGQQCAVFVPSHIQTTYSRVVEQKCLLMNNEPIKA